jgi:hypothetical protein
MPTLFSVVNFECPALHGIVAEQYVCSSMRNGSSKLPDTVKCGLNKELLLNFFVAEKESVTSVLNRLNNA